MNELNNIRIYNLHYFKKVLSAIPILLSLLLSAHSYASTAKLTLSNIYDLKNPYREKTADSPGLVEGSEEYIHFNGLFDRFEYCQTDGMVVFIGFANHIDVMKQAGSPETKFDAMKYMANQRNLEYPFDAEEIAGSSKYSVEKLAIEMGWKHPGSSDAHLENVAPLFWDKCLQIPISIFEAEWKEVEEAYDEE